MPAEAGIHAAAAWIADNSSASPQAEWTPAFAGVTPERGAIADARWRKPDVPPFTAPLPSAL